MKKSIEFENIEQVKQYYMAKILSLDPHYGRVRRIRIIGDGPGFMHPSPKPSSKTIKKIVKL